MNGEGVALGRGGGNVFYSISFELFIPWYMTGRAVAENRLRSKIFCSRNELMKLLYKLWYILNVATDAR